MPASAQSSAGEPYEQAVSALPAAMLLAAAGGILDAVVYLEHGHVFANAMTGNVVLLGISLVTADWSSILPHLVPIVAFLAGVLASRLLRTLPTSPSALAALGLEAVVLAGVALLPPSFPHSPLCLDRRLRLCLSGRDLPASGELHLQLHLHHRQPAGHHGWALRTAYGAGHRAPVTGEGKIPYPRIHLHLLSGRSGNRRMGFVSTWQLRPLSHRTRAARCSPARLDPPPPADDPLKRKGPSRSSSLSASFCNPSPVAGWRGPVAS